MLDCSVGLAQTIRIQCLRYTVFLGKEITKYTVIYSVSIRFWPTLLFGESGIWVQSLTTTKHRYTRGTPIAQLLHTHGTVAAHPWYNCCTPMAQLLHSHGTIAAHPWYNCCTPMAKLLHTHGTIAAHPWHNCCTPMVQLLHTHGTIAAHPWHNCCTPMVQLLHTHGTIAAHASAHPWYNAFNNRDSEFTFPDGFNKHFNLAIGGA